MGFKKFFSKVVAPVVKFLGGNPLISLGVSLFLAWVLRPKVPEIEDFGTNEFDDLAIISKGLNMDTLTQRIRKVDNWNTDITVRCDADQTGTGYTGLSDGWDEEGAIREEGKWSVSNNLQVSFLSFDEVVANFDTKKSGTICFSKDGTWYSADGEFESDNEIIEAFYICNRTAAITKCNVTAPFSPKPELPIPGTEHKYVFEINWSRFGNITMEKWNNDEREWVKQ